MDETRLIFKVEKELWAKKEGGIFIWRSSRPSEEGGKILKDSILIFNRLSPFRVGNLHPLEFLVIPPGSGRIDMKNTVDFFDYEIKDLVEENALRLLDENK